MHQCFLWFFPDEWFTPACLAIKPPGKITKKAFTAFKTINAKSSRNLLTDLKATGFYPAPVSRKEYQLTSELVEEPHLDTRHGFTGDAIVVIKFPDFGIAAVDINQIEIKACPFGHVISVTERDLPCMATLNRR